MLDERQELTDDQRKQLGDEECFETSEVIARRKRQEEAWHSYQDLKAKKRKEVFYEGVALALSSSVILILALKGVGVLLIVAYYVVLMLIALAGFAGFAMIMYSLLEGDD